MNLGSLIYAILDQTFIAIAALVFFSIYYKKWFFNAEKVNQLEIKLKLFKSRKLVFGAGCFMVFYFFIKLIDNLSKLQ